MATRKNKTPDFFTDEELDPMETATGYQQVSSEMKTGRPSGKNANNESSGTGAVKKKAGFYLPIDLINRFNFKFHELKLAGVDIDNKSTLLETALGFALDDMDKGEDSLVLQKLKG